MYIIYIKRLIKININIGFVGTVTCIVTFMSCLKVSFCCQVAKDLILVIFRSTLSASIII